MRHWRLLSELLKVAAEKIYSKNTVRKIYNNIVRWNSRLSTGKKTRGGGGGQNLERRNVERPIFRDFKTANIKITDHELFDCFNFEFISSLFINYLHKLIFF